MKPTISKHCAGRNYNSPFKQEKSVEANVSIDKDRKMLSPSLSATSGAISANASANVTPKRTGYEAGIEYNKGGFNAGVGVEGANKGKSNVTAHLGYKKTF
jgi:hypothetical protein